jgi:hypothetical protein
VGVTGAGSLLTLGDDAESILAQSVGGGGGLANSSCANSGSVSAQGLSGSACFGNNGNGGSGNVSPWNGGLSATAIVGGKSGSSGDGGAVTIDAEGAIQTKGARSIGIVAQSIGGGGGFTSAANQNLASTALQNSPGQNYAKGGAVSVSLGTSAATASIGHLRRRRLGHPGAEHRRRRRVRRRSVAADEWVGGIQHAAGHIRQQW